MARGVERHHVVLRAVDDAGLHGREHFAQGHRRRAAAHGLDHRHEQVRLRHTHLEPLHVSQRFHRPLGGVHRPRAPVVKRQAHEALRFHRGEDVVAHGAVEHTAHVGRVAEHVRQCDDHRLRHHAVQRAGVNAHHVEATDLDLLDVVLFRAQRAGGVHLHAQATLGLLGERLAHLFHCQRGRVIRRMHFGRAEVARQRGQGKG